MIAPVLLMLLLSAPTAALAQSSQSCPWLNSGTAAKVLGADVIVDAHSDSNWSGSCHFISAADSASSIEITVGSKESHPCGVGAKPLTGIGNTAELCSSRNSAGRDVQTVTGRVRNAWFTVTLAMQNAAGEHAHPSRDPSTPPAVEFLAEQVAGNLY